MDGWTMKVRRKDVETVNRISDELMQLTGLSYETAKYDKMVIRDVNNYAAKYDYGEIKFKGAFEIDKELHKDPSMKIVPIALKEYFFNGVPIKETVTNHKCIYDFCHRLKLNRSADGFFDYIDEEGNFKTDSIQKTTRFYTSNRGGSIYKIGTQFAKKPGSKTGINIGTNSTIFNQYVKKEDYDINYQYYINECNKIVDIIENRQLSLFDLFN